MEKVDLADVGQAALSGKPDRRAVDEALGTTELALKYYELEPGEALSGGYHTHENQEEVFVVLEGEATWDTEAGEASLTVGEGEAVRFAPGEFQHGYATDEPVRALALGAPPGMEDTVTVFTCPACGEETEHDVDLDAAARTSTTTCRNCGEVLETQLGE